MPIIKSLLDMELKSTTGASHGRCYALNIKVTYFRNHPYIARKYNMPNPTWMNSQNVFCNNINAFELEKVSEWD